MPTLADVLEQHPNLSAHGFRTHSTKAVEFAKAREQLVNDCEEQIAAALRFLDGVQLIKSMAPHRSSYGLKHTAEKHQGTYISNGAMIAALLMAGVPIKPFDNSPNTAFAISVKWLKSKE